MIRNTLFLLLIYFIGDQNIDKLDFQNQIEVKFFNILYVSKFNAI